MDRIIPILAVYMQAALGLHDRDAESGAVLLDLAVHADVVQYVWLINSFADKLYWKGLHGDKDTFALAFAMAGKAHCYGQVQVHPGVCRVR